jgi:hypothetical protein
MQKKAQMQDNKGGEHEAWQNKEDWIQANYNKLRDAGTPLPDVDILRRAVFKTKQDKANKDKEVGPGKKNQKKRPHGNATCKNKRTSTTLERSNFPELCDYEKLVEANKARNQSIMLQLGIHRTLAQEQAPRRKTAQRKKPREVMAAQERRRGSLRIQSNEKK